MRKKTTYKREIKGVYLYYMNSLESLPLAFKYIYWGAANFGEQIVYIRKATCDFHL